MLIRTPPHPSPPFRSNYADKVVHKWRVATWANRITTSERSNLYHTINILPLPTYSHISSRYQYSLCTICGVSTNWNSDNSVLLSTAVSPVPSVQFSFAPLAASPAALLWLSGNLMGWSCRWYPCDRDGRREERRLIEWKNLGARGRQMARKAEVISGKVQRPRTET